MTPDADFIVPPFKTIEFAPNPTPEVSTSPVATVYENMMLVVPLPSKKGVLPILVASSITWGAPRTKTGAENVNATRINCPTV